jgi:hypothetical protein
MKRRKTTLLMLALMLVSCVKSTGSFDTNGLTKEEGLLDYDYGSIVATKASMILNGRVFTPSSKAYDNATSEEIEHLLGGDKVRVYRDNQGTEKFILVDKVSLLPMKKLTIPCFPGDCSDDPEFKAEVNGVSYIYYYDYGNVSYAIKADGTYLNLREIEDNAMVYASYWEADNSHGVSSGVISIHPRAFYLYEPR